MREAAVERLGSPQLFRELRVKTIRTLLFIAVADDGPLSGLRANDEGDRSRRIEVASLVKRGSSSSFISPASRLLLFRL